MARRDARLADNAPGDLFVDDACIDCETCRHLAPSVFGRSDRLGMSIVARQPASDDERRRAAMAVVACPTSAIGTRDAEAVRAAAERFPERIDGEVYFCGYTSADSFGAWSWLIRRAEGNVLVDSPRAASPLFRRIDALGGVRTMLLTHRDDVAEHARIARRFGCARVLHEDDVSHGTRDVERRIEGGDPVALAPDLLVIPVPGHTRGSIALLVGERYLFTGDHLWGDGGELGASRGVCWYSWAEQTRSMERLLAYDFEWVLPGHGAPLHAPRAEMRRKLEALVARMKRAA